MNMSIVDIKSLKADFCILYGLYKYLQNHGKLFEPYQLILGI